MYTLYTRPGSGGFVVEAALRLAGVDYRHIDVPKADEPEPAFLDISPMNQVPVLLLPGGHPVTETAAMCILLAELHPGCGLGPVAGEPGRADFLRWLAFMAVTLYPADLRYYYAERYTADIAGIEAEQGSGKCARITDPEAPGRTSIEHDRFKADDTRPQPS